MKKDKRAKLLLKAEKLAAILEYRQSADFWWGDCFWSLPTDALDYDYYTLCQEYGSVVKQITTKSFPSFLTFVCSCEQSQIQWQKLLEGPHARTLLLAWLARNS